MNNGTIGICHVGREKMQRHHDGMVEIEFLHQREIEAVGDRPGAHMACQDASPATR